MEIPCTCGCDRSVCVDCMQDHIDSLHDDLRKLAKWLQKRAYNIADYPEWEQKSGYYYAYIEIRKLIER